tara:strand:+ start:313 stop:1173 length:861 start_codon:yes stop_codon:yes gene_type:complete
MAEIKHLRIGTRQSQLAMWQAKRIQTLISNYAPSIKMEIIPIETSGDINLTDSISEIGGKGIFLKEIEQALISNSIDIAVHSFKDITSNPHPQLQFSGFLLEESETDAFILFNNKSITDDALVIATGSLRRKALCKHLFSNITCVNIRGNIQTRIKKAEELGYDGLLLSTAGLQRLKLDHLISLQCNSKEFIPAPGQGFIAIQNRIQDTELGILINNIVPQFSQKLGGIYFDFLKGIEFNCQLPLGAHIKNNNIDIFLEHKTAQYFSFPVNEIQLAIDTLKGVIID